MGENTGEKFTLKVKNGGEIFGESYKGWPVIATILMLAITQSIAGKWHSDTLKDKYNNNLTIQGLIQV